MSSLARTLRSWVRIKFEAWMSVCVYSVYIVLCVDCDLAKGWSPVQGVLPTVYRINKLKRRPRPNIGLQSHNNNNNNNHNYEWHMQAGIRILVSMARMRPDTHSTRLSIWNVTPCSPVCTIFGGNGYLYFLHTINSVFYRDDRGSTFLTSVHKSATPQSVISQRAINISNLYYSAAIYE
jgi:hypothetical protein